jgi:hypothetical protein
MKGAGMKMLSMFFAFLLLVSLVVAGTTAAWSYERKVVIATNPILDMFTWYNGEVEVAVAPTSTVGAAGTYLTFGDEDEDDEETFANASVFYRYYPREAYGGFFFGARGGYYRVTAQDEETGDEESGDFFGFGIDIGYSWLLGAEERFNVSLGVGAVRLLGGDLEDVTLTLPTIRFINVGVAF